MAAEGWAEARGRQEATISSDARRERWTPDEPHAVRGGARRSASPTAANTAIAIQARNAKPQTVPKRVSRVSSTIVFVIAEKPEMPAASAPSRTIWAAVATRPMRGADPEDDAQARRRRRPRRRGATPPPPRRGAQRGQPAEEEEGDAADRQRDRRVLEPAREAVGDLGHLAVAGAADQFADRLASAPSPPCRSRRRSRWRRCGRRRRRPGRWRCSCRRAGPASGGRRASALRRSGGRRRPRRPVRRRRRRRGPRRSSPRPARRIRR